MSDDYPHLSAQQIEERDFGHLRATGTGRVPHISEVPELERKVRALTRALLWRPKN